MAYRLLDGDLLIEEHADQERERLLGEQEVGRPVAGDVERGHGGQSAA